MEKNVLKGFYERKGITVHDLIDFFEHCRQVGDSPDNAARELQHSSTNLPDARKETARIFFFFVSRWLNRYVMSVFRQWKSKEEKVVQVSKQKELSLKLVRHFLVRLKCHYFANTLRHWQRITRNVSDDTAFQPVLRSFRRLRKGQLLQGFKLWGRLVRNQIEAERRTKIIWHCMARMVRLHQSSALVQWRGMVKWYKHVGPLILRHWQALM